MSTNPPRLHRASDAPHDPQKASHYPVRVRLSAGKAAAVHGAEDTVYPHTACNRACGIVPDAWIFPPDTKITCLNCIKNLAPQEAAA